MADFTSKKYQVFVSSTYTDLKIERQAAVEAILTAGHIPAGMELFTAGDESQWEVIKQWIDESDIYMLILGGRYGSMEPKSGKSYTQLEYEYAVEAKKPLFACVANEAALEARTIARADLSLLEKEYPRELYQFREAVKSRMVRFWDDPKDVKLCVIESLVTLTRRSTLVGWVRGDHATDTAVTNELARLSAENALLQKRHIELLQEVKGMQSAKELSLDAVTLLTSAAKCGGEIRVFQSSAGDEMMTDDMAFSVRNERGFIDKKIAAKWKFALGQLLSNGLVENTNDDGILIYSLTHLGYLKIDEIWGEGTFSDAG